MNRTLFPDLAPPQAPKSDRTRYIRQAQAVILQIGLRGREVRADVAWTGEKLMIPAVLMEKYAAKYPRLDITPIIIDAERWLLKNPAKAAGYKSFDAFLNNWLRKEDGKRRERDPDADYELTGDSLAKAQECANLFGRAGNE